MGKLKIILSVAALAGAAVFGGLAVWGDTPTAEQVARQDPQVGNNAGQAANAGAVASAVRAGTKDSPATQVAPVASPAISPGAVSTTMVEVNAALATDHTIQPQAPKAPVVDIPKGQTQ